MLVEKGPYHARSLDITEAVKGKCVRARDFIIGGDIEEIKCSNACTVGYAFLQITLFIIYNSLELPNLAKCDRFDIFLP